MINIFLEVLLAGATSSPVERSYSKQGRIHTKERASMGREKVVKILFCVMNDKYLPQKSKWARRLPPELDYNPNKNQRMT